MSCARDFLKGIVDYAGLFPPASLGMPEAVGNYAEYLRSEANDLLGKFVLPVARLEEFGSAAARALPRGDTGHPWHLSVIAGDDLAAGRQTVLEFNCGHWRGSKLGHAICDSIETRVGTPERAKEVTGAFPAFFQLFLEVPTGHDGDVLVSSLAGTRAAAKIRTGGVVASAIPPSDDVAAFVESCQRHGVRFKTTAGLHHALTSSYPLTYEADAPTAVMFGYLNVFLAAAFHRAGLIDEALPELLEEQDPAAFAFGSEFVAWREHRLSVSQLMDARQNLALSFGSCSFVEPVEEARQLGLLGT